MANKRIFIDPSDYDLTDYINEITRLGITRRTNVYGPNDLIEDLGCDEEFGRFFLSALRFNGEISDNFAAFLSDLMEIEDGVAIGTAIMTLKRADFILRKHRMKNNS